MVNNTGANNTASGAYSLEEVDKNGFDMADMNNKLLEKIEQLHLYVLQLQKQSKNQQKQIDALMHDRSKK